MKFRHFLMAAAALFTLAACQEKEELGAAMISADPTTITLGPEAGASGTIALTATRTWSVSKKPDWVTVTPSSGQGSTKPQTITFTAKANDGTDRSSVVGFTIGLSECAVTVTQTGEAGDESAALIYGNNFDKEDAANNSGWPKLDASDCWKNETGNGIANIKYEFAGMSARQSGKLSNDTDPKYSKYSGSGHNKLFFGTSALFAVKNIALDGKTSVKLSFGGQRYSGDDTDNTFKFEEFQVYASIDGLKGVPVPCTFGGGEAPNGAWDLISGKFSVPAGTENLTIVFKVIDTKNGNSKYSIDDLRLIASAGGEALDFSKATTIGLDASELIEDTDKVTNLADIIKQASGTEAKIYNTTVTATTTKGYVISDGTTHIYVYKNAAPSVKIGDKISLIGTFKYYWGEYEIVEASEKITGTAVPAYPEKVEADAAWLKARKDGAAADEESTNYKGPWYPIYIHFSATVKKEGSYTNFYVKDSNDKISLVHADAALYKDEKGTEFSDGNEVEVIGFYTGWESKNSYHQVIGISVTGEATWNPAAATLTGDDVFVAQNAAHDAGVANSEVLPATVFGDATISFAGGGNNGKYYAIGTGVRIYNNGGSIKVESPRTIAKIEYLFAPKESNNTYMPASSDKTDVGTITLDTKDPKAVWTGSAKSVTLTNSATGGHWRLQEVAVTYGGSADDPYLSASPATLTVDADATSAKFNVQANVAWTIESNNPDFVATPAEGTGSKEVTVTFPANTSLENAVTAVLTVSSDDVDDATVTITQKKAVDPDAVTDLSEIWDAASGTPVELYNVVVSAVTYKNFVVTDGNKALYIYSNSNTHGRKIGDKVNITGSTSWYKGLLEITSPKVTLVSSNNDVLYPEPVELTGAVLNADYEKSENNSPFYAKFTAVTTFSEDNKYVQFTPEGANHYLSLSDPPNDVKETLTENEEVTVYGYYGSWNSTNNFHQFYYVYHEPAGGAAPYLRVNNKDLQVAYDSEGTSFIVTTNVEGWKAESDNPECVVDYTTAGAGVVMVTYPVNEDTENAKVYHVTVSADEVDDVVVTITVAAAPDPDAAKEVTIDLTKNTAKTVSESQMVWENDAVTLTLEKNTSTNNANKYYGGDSSNHTSTRMYDGQKLTIAPKTGNTLESVVVTAASTNYATALGGFSMTNATAAVNSEKVTVTPTDGTAAIEISPTAVCGMKTIVISYKNQ